MNGLIQKHAYSFQCHYYLKTNEFITNECDKWQSRKLHMTMIEKNWWLWASSGLFQILILELLGWQQIVWQSSRRSFSNSSRRCRLLQSIPTSTYIDNGIVDVSSHGGAGVCTMFCPCGVNTITLESRKSCTLCLKILQSSVECPCALAWKSNRALTSKPGGYEGITGRISFGTINPPLIKYGSTWLYDIGSRSICLTGFLGFYRVCWHCWFRYWFLTRFLCLGLGTRNARW